MSSVPSLVRRGFTGLLSTAVLAAGLVVLADAPASAATAGSDTGYNVVDRNPTTGVTADALPTTQIDGVAWDQAIVGDTVYAGGQFTTARPAGAAAGVNTVTRNNLLSYNLRTGVLNTGFAPNVNGRIRAMAVSPDKSRVYIVGSFTQVNGVSRSRVAAFNTSDGSLVSSFAPTAGSDVFSIAVSDSAVYLGGFFTTMNGVSRTRLAAVSPTTGATLAWAPTADSTVQAMTLTPDKSRLIVGGAFGNLNGSTTPGLGSLDASTGALYPFAANQVIQDYGTSASIFSLKADDTNIYGTGYWYGGTGNFEGMFEADPLSGAIKTMADCHGDSYDVSPANGVIYTVSHAHDCTNMNGFPDTNPRNRWTRSNAYTMNATTTTGPNNAGGYASFQGQPSSSIINWYPDVASGTYTGQGQGGWTTEATSEYVVQGGEFPSVNGTPQQGLVRFAIPSIAPNKVGPSGKTVESAPSLRGISGTSVRVSWLSNYDRDDSKLTYNLYRSGTTAPILTKTTTSYFWSRPTQVFTDTGLTNNKSYSYYVTATDANGNTMKGGTSSITTGTAVVDNSAYSQAVTNDGATHYWRLNETAGQTSSVDWVGGNDLALGAGVTNGAAGAIGGSPDTAATFDGTGNGTAGESSAEAGPDAFSAEAWFSTTSTSGGKIIGFGNSQTGTSGSYDRQVYLDNAGHIVFGVYPGSVRSVVSSNTFNDGSYHHVVATLSSAGMKLYVDGLLQASDASTTSAQGYSGYWRVGGDNLNGWTNQPSSYNLAGTIDDVAIYPTALSVTQVRDHYTKSGRTVDLPPAPADAYGKQVVGDNPSFYWRLNETTGSTVADASENKVAGNVYGGVTLGTSSDVAPGTAATFDGANGTVATATAFPNPTTYSEEIWFKTTTTNGGKLIGFGNQQNGNSNNYDRHVYMENSGQLTYGVYTGQLNTITSPTAYNNGTWHQMVATQDTVNGMKLYVDGTLVGTNPQTSSQAYDGYWRVGGDSSWGGNSYYFAGQLDEAAVYPTALTAAQVKAHYNASPAAVNAAPVASFTTACTDGSCYADGSGSTDDGSIAGYAWDFGDGLGAGSKATGSTATHTYAASGTYTVSLTVTDDKGLTTTTTKDVTVTVPAANVAPTAAFTSTCTELVCAFDSSTSADSDGTIAGYAWTFGDGSTSAVASPSHTYAANGTYTVALTVTDNKGATSTETKTLTVAKNNVAPVAAFTSTVADLKVSVDGSTSADSDGTIASYDWTYGDGSTGTGKTDSHSYAAAGTYDVTLKVADNQGLTHEVTQQVTATVPVNVKPTAAFTSSAADLKVSVDGASSTDSDGTVASYDWTYGDGGTGTGKTDSHTYATAGTYEVKLVVTDNSGATDSVTKSVTVTAAPPANVKPTAAFTSSATNLALSVDGSTSTDSDGTVASYAWTYGDGGTGSGKTDSHSYAAAGTYSVKLTVTDNAGATDSVTKSVTVTAAAPVSTVVASDAFGRTGSKWGTADKGGAWTDSGASYFSTSGGKGLLAVTKAGSGPTATLSSVSALDSTTTAEFSVDKVATGSGFYVILSSRKQGTSEYRLKARLLSDGTVRLGTSVLVNGTETSLGESATGLTYTAGQVFDVRFDVSGTGTTTLQGKIWKASGTEPATAQTTATNTAAGLQSAGAVAVQGYLSASSTSAPVTVSFDNLVVTRN